jgi:hypothetical protein
MSPAALLAALAMPLFLAVAISLASALTSLAHIVFTRAARAPKTTARKYVFSFALGGLANTVSVSVDMQSYAVTSTPPSTPPTQVPQQQKQKQHAQPVCETLSETAPAPPSVPAAANAKMKRVARSTRALECAAVPGVVELPIRGMQCAVM